MLHALPLLGSFEKVPEISGNKIIQTHHTNQSIEVQSINQSITRSIKPIKNDLDLDMQATNQSINQSSHNTKIINQILQTTYT